MVEIAQARRWMPLPTGATGRNDQVRFELTAAGARAADHRPWRDERYRKDFPGRREMIDYCAAKDPVAGQPRNPIPRTGIFSRISYEAESGGPWHDAGDLKNRDYTTLSVLRRNKLRKPRNP